jgi:Tol biopolymer transport system component
VFAVPFDRRRLSVAGERVAIVEGVRRSDGAQTGAAQFAVSDTGSLVYIPGHTSGSAARSDLVVTNRTGSVEKLNIPSGAYQTPRISPDGKRVALTIDGPAAPNIWIYDLSNESTVRQLTLGGRNQFPVWTPDGQRVAFQSDREGDAAIFWQRADGTDSAQRLTRAEHGVLHIPDSWFRTGDRFLFSRSTGSGFSLWSFFVREAKAEPFGDVESSFPLNAVLSPDGRWVAYSLFTPRYTGLFVEPVPRTGAKYRISPTAIHPLWSPEGKDLFYTSGTLLVVTVTTARGFEFSSPVQIPKPFQNPGPTAGRVYDMMPDGRLIGIVPSGSGQLSSFNQINVVLNWFEELKQQVPPVR